MGYASRTMITTTKLSADQVALIAKAMLYCEHYVFPVIEDDQSLPIDLKTVAIRFDQFHDQYTATVRRQAQEIENFPDFLLEDAIDPVGREQTKSMVLVITAAAIQEATK